MLRDCYVIATRLLRAYHILLCDYDVIASHVIASDPTCARDASFTTRDTADFEQQLERGVVHLQASWPAARVVLITM